MNFIAKHKGYYLDLFVSLELGSRRKLVEALEDIAFRTNLLKNLYKV
tara:strand:+ start:547 stop:687 length:141 start_codon:yes stop_codon:yes gene_type:complete